MYTKAFNLIILSLSLPISAAQFKTHKEKEPLEQFASNRDSAMLLFGVGPTAATSITSILSTERAALVVPISEKRSASNAQLIENLKSIAERERAKRESNIKNAAQAQKRHDLLRQHTQHKQHTKEARINNSRRISAEYSASLLGAARRVSAPERAPLVAAAVLKPKAHSMPPTRIVRLHRRNAIVAETFTS